MITSARCSTRSVLFVQLPIPPAGPSPIIGNVPLAAGYLILHARARGLDRHFQFEILPPKICNYHSDLGIVDAIIEREPGIVGFSCYLWNIDRTLWIATQLKRLRPEIIIVLGGPEITNDNAWVFASGVVDFAAFALGTPTQPKPKSEGGRDVARLVALNAVFDVNCALMVDRLVGLRGAEVFAASCTPPAPAPAYFGHLYTDKNGEHWQEINLQLLAQQPEFMAVAA